jgi:hypothetical protein
LGQVFGVYFTQMLLSGAADEVSVYLFWHLSLIFVMKSVENSSSSHGSLSLLFVTKKINMIKKIIMIVRHIESIVFLWLLGVFYCDIIDTKGKEQ